MPFDAVKLVTAAVYGGSLELGGVKGRDIVSMYEAHTVDAARTVSAI